MNAFFIYDLPSFLSSSFRIRFVLYGPRVYLRCFSEQPDDRSSCLRISTL